MVDHTKLAVLRHPSPNAKRIVTIDAETWAESGGTGGMFATAWKQGRLKIVETPEDGESIVEGL